LAVSSSSQAQLGPTGTQFWSQNSVDSPVALEENAFYGYALAAGDFDCDGFDDLAVGMPGEDLVGGDDAGRLIVMYSGSTGPGLDENQVWGQNSPVIADDAELNDGFGEVLTAGDFDDDGCSDLVIGVPGEGLGGDLNVGAVHVLYGTVDGLTGDDDDFWHQDLESIDGVAEAGDLFGDALAVGDFDGDGVDDLAIGAPGEDIEADSTINAGAVHILFGSASGLTATGSILLYRGQGIGGPSIEGELLGSALAAADFVPLFAGDDLAIGARGHDVGAEDQAGAVVLVSDLTGSIFDSTWTSDSSGVPGASEEFDRWGSNLAAGDFDGDGLFELAVSAAEEDNEGAGFGDVGAVTILDFDGDTMQIWTQDDLNPEAQENDDQFGVALAAGDFDADGIDDLAIGANQENLGPILDAGMVHVLHGSAGAGLTNDDDQIWIQTIDPSDDGDMFGFSLVAGHFAGHSGSDLAIGAPWETIGAFEATGGVNVIYSDALFRDAFESGDSDAWSATAG
jgi:hypothetical protein